jgi:hypothetical protein
VPNLHFSVQSAEVARSAATPAIVFKLRIETVPPGQKVQSLLLHCQVQIQSARRRYTAEEQSHLYDLFDRPERWGETLQPLTWTNAVTVVSSFLGSTTADLPIACTFDFNVAATKYLRGLKAGEVPLALLFSGTVFYEGPGGQMQVAQVPWSSEAQFRLPVQLWKDMMAAYYPHSAWLCVRDDLMERLSEFKTRRGLPDLNAAMEALLAEVKEGVGS